MHASGIKGLGGVLLPFGKFSHAVGLRRCRARLGSRAPIAAAAAQLPARASARQGPDRPRATRTASTATIKSTESAPLAAPGRRRHRVLARHDEERPTCGIEGSAIRWGRFSQLASTGALIASVNGVLFGRRDWKNGGSHGVDAGVRSRPAAWGRAAKMMT